MSSPTSPLPNYLAGIVERFQRQGDPKWRYEQLIWYAKRLKEFPADTFSRQWFLQHFPNYAEKGLGISITNVRSAQLTKKE